MKMGQQVRGHKVFSSMFTPFALIDQQILTQVMMDGGERAANPFSLSLMPRTVENHEGTSPELTSLIRYQHGLEIVKRHCPSHQSLTYVSLQLQIFKDFSDLYLAKTPVEGMSQKTKFLVESTAGLCQNLWVSLRPAARVRMLLAAAASTRKVRAGSTPGEGGLLGGNGKGWWLLDGR